MMKQIATLLMLVANTTIVLGQTYFEDFEGYEAFDRVSKGSPYLRTWSAGGTEPYMLGRDAIVSNVRAYSGENAMFLFSNNAGGGPMDMVLDFGGTFDRGVIEVRWQMQVKEGKGAFFYLKSTEIDGSRQLMECNLHDDSTSYWYVDSLIEGTNAYMLASTGSIPNFRSEIWQEYKILIDLDQDSLTFTIDGKLVGKTPLVIKNETVGGINFYPLSPMGDGASYWIDDLRLEKRIPQVKENIALENGSVSGGRLVGEYADLHLQLRNEYADTLRSVVLECQYGDTTFQEAIDVKIARASSANCSIDSLVLQENASKAEITLISFNGNKQDLNPNGNAMDLDIQLIKPVPGKRVLIEEGTGTWCGWCPRGAFTMKEMEKNYGQWSAGVAIHYGDPMESQHYTNTMNEHYFQGYPSGTISRTHSTGMGYESLKQFFYDELEKAPTATFSVGAQLQQDKLAVAVDYTFYENASDDWRVACILTEDSVTGTEAEYAQANFYSNSPTPMGGYETLPQLIPADQMVYNQVARSMVPSVFGAPLEGLANSGDKHTYHFQFTISPNWDPNHLRIIPVLIRPDSTVDNVGLISLQDAIKNGYKDGNAFTSIEEKAVVQALYPNPAHQMLYAEISVPTARIEVIAIDGKTAQSMELNQGINHIPLHNITPGLYTVMVTTDNSIYQRKIIIE